MKTRLLTFAADVHLEDAAWKYRPISGDAYNSWRQIVRFCIDSGSDLVLLGDILDRVRPSSNAVVHLAEGIRRMQGAGLRVCAILGQHDDTDPPWYALFGDYVTMLTFRPVEIGGRAVAGMGYTASGKLDQPLARIIESEMDPSTEVMCLHQLLHEVSGGGQGDLGLADLPDVPVVALGDYHENIVFPATKPRQRHVFYTGSSSMQKIDEGATKYVVQLDASDVMSTARLNTRRIVRESVRTDEELESLLNSLGPSENDHIDLPTVAYVEYPGTIPDAHKRLMSKCRDLGYYFWPAPFVDSGAPVEAVREGMSFKECLARLAKEGSPEHRYISSLCEAEEIRKAAASMRPAELSDIGG